MLQHNDRPQHANNCRQNLPNVMLKHNLLKSCVNGALQFLGKFSVTEFRRCFVPGATYFFTVVTAGGRPLFLNEQARTILGDAMRDEFKAQPFDHVAIVLLPEHLHAIWTLQPGDDHYSDRWKSIKAKFTREWISSGGSEINVSRGYVKQRRRGVWQARSTRWTP
jgi:putative transposase